MMKIGIRYKLFLAMLAAACALVATMFFFVRWSFHRGFLNYVNTVEEEHLDTLVVRLEENYAEFGSWGFLKGDPRRWHHLIRSSFPRDEMADREELPPPPGARRGPERGMAPASPAFEREPPPPGPGHGLPPRPRPEMGELFEMRVILLDAGKNRLFGPREAVDETALRAIEHNGGSVGYLGLIPSRMLSDVHQVRFFEGQKEAFGLIALCMIAAAAALSIPFAHGLVQRVERLTAATHDLASGRYDTRIPVTSADELGRLASDFNALALTLEKNELGRRQWVADISHELRTPIALLRGELEALQDGVRKLTPETFSALQGDITRLERLVNDLYELALSDIGALTYRKADVDLASVVEAAVEQFQDDFAEKGIAMDLDAAGSGALTLFADSERLHQLFVNLLGNSLRYTDPGGKLEVRLAVEGKEAVVELRDSSPGVPEEAIEKLFDRFFRLEASRSRAYGGAGLGLAICRNIVEAHSGTIKLSSSPLGGLRVNITLPLVG